jgi:hypothetical protein
VHLPQNTARYLKLVLQEQKSSKIICLKASIVAAVVTSITGINHTNFEKASTQTNNMLLPALVSGNFPIFSINGF